MAHRIEVKSKIADTRAEVRKRKLEAGGLGRKIKDVEIVDVYTIDADLQRDEVQKAANMLANPVFQESKVDEPITPERFDYAIEVGFLPGVTDNIGTTAKESVSDLLKRDFAGQAVHSSQLMFVSGELSKEDALRIGESIANPLMQRIQVKSYEEFIKSDGMGISVPQVRINVRPTATLVNILEANEEELATTGKQGIVNYDGSRRGPLALDLNYMKTIRDYFARQGRNPTDVELESIAQTWSEHCHHTIFADPIDEVKEGLYERFIKGATEKIRRAKGDKDFCVSVFKDNSGAIIFDENHLITDKVETHNSPSALDPFGGAITGIVGVNRDAIGFGLGAKPIINRYGFCFADPRNKASLFKGKNRTQPMLSAARILEGVVDGVNAGGNQSGIPSPQGFVYFDERYRGKPLVFVGTIGLIPRVVEGRKMHEKKAQPGDYVVMVGGRVGKDGIHGATFSSEAMDSGSPATAVQIGDPITQKKLSDAIVKEARDRNLYTSITDNGAGGLSCSVAEMARESGGCAVDLGKVPLKYPGLAPWEIWISESQERMTLSIPKEKWDGFSKLMVKRGVEASVIGEFTNSGKCVVEYEGQKVMDVDMEFLHDGLPVRPMQTTYKRQVHEAPSFREQDGTEILHAMLARPNLASFEFISLQYDHEVQGGSVVKPLQGRGRVNGDATVTRPVLNSKKGVVISQALNPSYSDIDTYQMAVATVDTAVRNTIAVGGKLEQIVLLDNFCWCSSNEQERLAQLKDAVRGCYDAAVEYGTPFISGKDSMFNDFKGFDENGKPIKISVPPTLLISSIAVIDDTRKAVTLDAKRSGDIVYLLGATHNELGGSEYFAMVGEQTRGQKFIGNYVPEVKLEINKITYDKLSEAIEKELVASAQSVHRGGLALALAKTAMGGKLGMEIDLQRVVRSTVRDDFTLYSESQGRIVVTVNPARAREFEKTMGNSFVSRVGFIRDDESFIIGGLHGKAIVRTDVNAMLRSYKSTFGDY